MCGNSTADRDPHGFLTRIAVGFFVPIEKGGTLSANNLRAICLACAEGLAAAPYQAKPTLQELLGEFEAFDNSELRDLLLYLSSMKR